MRNAKKWLVGLALGLKLLSGVEGEALAKSPEIKKVELKTEIDEINQLKQTLAVKGRQYLSDQFVNVDEYRNLERLFNKIIQKINKLLEIEQNADKETKARLQLEIKTLNGLMADLKKIYQEDQKVLTNASEINLKQWWNKEGIFKGNHNKKSSLFFVVKVNKSYSTGLSRSSGEYRVESKIKKILGSMGMAQKAWGFQYHHEEKFVWVMAIVHLE